MELYPAVDIEGGRVARAHGRVAEPLAALDAFTRAGARWIHLVDMDRAYGRSDNLALITAVLTAAKVRVQVGGGLFRGNDIDHMFTPRAPPGVIWARGARDARLVDRMIARHGAAPPPGGLDAEKRPGAP